MPRKRPHISATLLIFLLALHLTTLYGVAAKFRGAIHKPIPTIGDDGTAAKLRVGMKTKLAAEICTLACRHWVCGSSDAC